METRRILLYRGVCGNNKISAIASSKIVVKLNFEEFENTHTFDIFREGSLTYSKLDHVVS